MTTNHPAHGPVSLERLHQIRQYLERNNQYSNGGNRAYILADVLKVIDGAIAAFGAEPVAWQWEYRDKRHVTNDQRRSKIVAEDGEVLVQPLYTAPPAPEPMKDHQIRELVNDLRDIAVEYHGTQQLRERIARTVRAAMLQAGNSPVTPDVWIHVSERMPDKLIPVMVMYEDGEMWSAMWNGNRWDDGTEYPDPHSVTHWREMPAAPQQEVKP